MKVMSLKCRILMKKPRMIVAGKKIGRKSLDVLAQVSERAVIDKDF